MSTSPDSVASPFVLPGQIPDRETVEGWKQWRLTRHSFVRAPRLDLAAYQALSPRKRQLHDLHRAATHANLPLLETPMTRAVGRIMRSRLQTNALKHKPTTRAGLMITGGGYQGKTETACEIAAAFEDAWLDMHAQLNPNAVPGTRDLHAPVAYVQTPVTAKPKSTCQAILDFFGADHQRMTLPQLTRAVRTSLHDHGNRVLLLDDITRLKMHRADDQDTLDLMRAFMSMHTTLVLVGVNIPGSGLLREGRHDPRTGQWVFPPPRGHLGDDPSTQTERRFDVVHLEPFSYDTPDGIAAWTAHLAGLQDELRLFDAGPDMLTGGTMPEYLFRRTGGVVGLLERLIEEGCTEALGTGVENLTEELLDGIMINLGNDPTRDPEAGEVPSVPAVSPPRRKRKPRNTVLDDAGTPAATG
ncbi:TniB family NTP-binding protein [Amycolatopsis sp. RTGN1]|uniref:TniB family NTP-binding protein n=1 Tax=Amycolatopsis ponsaeliensis TaxID=2992142 RepID=UPI00254F0D80|nr:TniB family NTP-binding protein [Amycolatopsis sp. RTGN1]